MHWVFIIEKGCSINHTDVYSQTPLYYAVRDNRMPTVLKLLELCGSEEEAAKYINHSDVENETCLFYSCIEGHLDMTKFLIERGADFTIENKLGQTVLDMCERKHPPVEEFLIALGAEKGKSNNKKKKKSGRPANVNTKKSYALWVLKNGEWVVATGEDDDEIEIFQMLNDPNRINEMVMNCNNEEVKQ